MVARKPLVNVSGTISELPAGDSLAGASGTDFASPPQIGNTTPNIGAFTFLSGSRALVATTIADGTTLGAAHIGRSVQINGGTINLPPDANWVIGDEIEFIVVGSNNTTLQWTGNSIVSASTIASTQVIAGGQANGVIVKKMAAGVAYFFAGDGINLASPGPIGNNVSSTGKFTFLTSSKALSSAVIAGGTTLTRAAHIGQVLQVNGGTINLPADADWAIGDEVAFFSVGPAVTTINGNGASINLGPFGVVTSTALGETTGQQAFFKKMGANLVFASLNFTYLQGLYGTAIVNQKLDDVLRFDGANWVNTPQNFSIYDLKNRAIIAPGSGSTITLVGYASTTAGTITHPQPASGTAYTEATRFVLPTSATAGNVAIIRSATTRMWRGNAAGKGGFRIRIPFGGAALQAGQRAFIGLESNTSAATNVDPFTTNTTAKLGVAVNNNTGNWFLINNAVGTTPTALDLGANFPLNNTTWYTLTLWCDPNGTGINYEIVNRNTNVGTLTGTLTGANIPTSSTYMHFYAWVTNNLTAAAASIALGTVLMEWG